MGRWLNQVPASNKVLLRERGCLLFLMVISHAEFFFAAEMVIGSSCGSSRICRVCLRGIFTHTHTHSHSRGKNADSILPLFSSLCQLAALLICTYLSFPDLFF